MFVDETCFLFVDHIFFISFLTICKSGSTLVKIFNSSSHSDDFVKYFATILRSSVMLISCLCIYGALTMYLQ